MRVELQGEGTPVRRISLLPSRTGDGKTRDVLLDPAGVSTLLLALKESEEDPRCRILVLEGRHPAFCRGMDLSFFTSLAGVDLAAEVRPFAECLARLCSSARIVLSVVDGEAAGGGVGLAAAADICIATARSTFSLPELVLGLQPGVVLPVLLRRLTLQKTRMLCLTGNIDAGRARDWGLVDRWVEDPEGLEKSLRSVIKHGLRCSPRAVAELKGLPETFRGLDLDQALEKGAETTARLLADGETIDGIRAFLEGESMPWFDRYRPDRRSK